MAGEPFTIDPESGTIYYGHGDNLTEVTDSVFLNGSNYTLQGSALVPEDPSFPIINPPTSGAWRIWADPNAKTHVSYGVDRRQINSQGVQSRTYGIGGTVDISLADGSIINYTLIDDSVTRSGMRFFKTVNAYGEQIIGETAHNLPTNTELRRALNDPYASYLSPLETIEEVTKRNIAIGNRKEVMDFMEKYKEEHGGDTLGFYEAVAMMIHAADFAGIEVFSNYWV